MENNVSLDSLHEYIHVDLNSQSDKNSYKMNNQIELGFD